MSIGNTKEPAGGKSSNYNWQLRMLQIAGKCCTPVVSELERLAIVNPPFGKTVYQENTTGTSQEGLYIYKSNAGGPGVPGWVFVA